MRTQRLFLSFTSTAPRLTRGALRVSRAHGERPASPRPRPALRGGGAARPAGGARGRRSCAMAATRVLLLLSGRAESPGFAHSVCRLLGAGPGLGPWSTHCGLKRGRLVLSDGPLPGASTRLPLQVGKRGPGAGGRWELAREAGGRVRVAQTRPPPPPSRGAARY